MTTPGKTPPSSVFGWLRMNLEWIQWIAVSLLVSSALGMIWTRWLQGNFHVGPIRILSFAFVSTASLFMLSAFWVRPAGLWSYIRLFQAIEHSRKGRYDEARRSMSKVRNPWASVAEVRALREHLESHPAESLALAENCATVCGKRFNLRWLRTGIFCAMIIAISVTGGMMTKHRGIEHGKQTLSMPAPQTNVASPGVETKGSARNAQSLHEAERNESAIPLGVGILAVLVGFRVIPLGKRSDGSPRVNDQIAKSAKWTGLAFILLGIFGLFADLIKAWRLSQG